MTVIGWWDFPPSTVVATAKGDQGWVHNIEDNQEKLPGIIFITRI